MKRGEGDEISLVFVGWKRIESMANLFDMDCPAERSLLGIVALELDAVLVVPDTIGCGRRMVAITIRSVLSYLTSIISPDLF